jgi:uncharacterized protein with PIN domain
MTREQLLEQIAKAAQEFFELKDEFYRCSTCARRKGFVECENKLRKLLFELKAL